MTLKGETFRQGTTELVRVSKVIGIISSAFAGRGCVKGVVDVVIPLRGAAFGGAGDAREMRRVILFVLDQDRYWSVKFKSPYSLGKLRYQRRIALIDDGVDRVEAKPIEMELFEPINGVMDYEVTDDR